MFTPRIVIGYTGDPADTTKTYQLPEVLVTADRSSITQTVQPSRIYQLSRVDLESSNGSTLGEILSGSPGTFVRTYGPGGGLQTVSLRGMDAEHTLVLIDGVPLNSAQNGQSDLRLLPLLEVEGVQIERGGASSAFGTNPLGGTVNIQTYLPSGQSGVTAGALAGSFGESGVDVLLDLDGSGVTPFSVGYSEQTGRDNFPFEVDQGGQSIRSERSNSDYRSRNLFVSGAWVPDSSRKSDLFVAYGEAERGTPGPFLTVENQGLARQQDRQLESFGSMQFIGGNTLGGTIAGTFQTAYEHYTNTAEPFLADNYYQDVLIDVLPNVEYRLFTSLNIVAGGELGSALAAGNAMPSDQHRNNAGIYLAPTIVLTGLLPDWRVSLFPSLRFDAYSGSEHAWSPRLGMSAELPFLGLRSTLHGVAGNSFRVPTFNELYYDGAGGLGNPELLPEHSFSAEGGITLRAEWVGTEECDLTYYSIRTRERIFWLPTELPSVYSPRNIGETISSGWECEFRWNMWGERVELGGTYAWLDAHGDNSDASAALSNIMQLPYVPLDMGGAYFDFRIPLTTQYVTGIFGKISDQYVGIRYITEDNSQGLPSYQVINTNVGFECHVVDLVIRTKYELNNLSNANYQAVSGYPMPLQHQSIRCDISKQF